MLPLSNERYSFSNKEQTSEIYAKKYDFETIAQESSTQFDVIIQYAILIFAFISLTILVDYLAQKIYFILKSISKKHSQEISNAQKCVQNPEEIILSKQNNCQQNQQESNLLLTLSQTQQVKKEAQKELCEGETLDQSRKQNEQNYSDSQEYQILCQDMNDQKMKEAIIQISKEAVQKATQDQKIAQIIKKELDKKFKPTWHVIVGKDFGSHVTYEDNSFLYFQIKQHFIMLFRAD